MAAAGVEPRVMGIGPVPATRKLMARLGLKIEDFDAIELNEAFASQSLAVLRALGLPDAAPQAIGTAHVCTPLTPPHLVCRLLPDHHPPPPPPPPPTSHTPP